MSGKRSIHMCLVKAARLGNCCISAGRTGTPDLQIEGGQHHRLATQAVGDSPSMVFFLKRLQGLVIWEMLSTICLFGTFILHSLILNSEKLYSKETNLNIFFQNLAINPPHPSPL